MTCFCHPGIILTASHNPGGPEGDFGVKYNTSNGGPAPQSVTDAMYERSKAITRVLLAEDLPEVDLGCLGRLDFTGPDEKTFTVCPCAPPRPAPHRTAPHRPAPPSASLRPQVEVIDSTEDYLALLRRVFDLGALRALVQRADFHMVYDALSGVAGPYAHRIFCEELGASPAAMHNCVPKPVRMAEARLSAGPSRSALRAPHPCARTPHPAPRPATPTLPPHPTRRTSPVCTRTPT